MTRLRIGSGFDVHAFAAGRPLVLGGVRVEHARGLAGHSDADVLVHAVVDALLGAASLGDIGEWFPASDPRYQDASSVMLLEYVTEALRRVGWRIVNVDATIIAQEPRLGPHRERIRASLAQGLTLEESRVSVKATTADHLGAIGRAEGIAAQAVVLLEAPDTIEGVPTT